MSSTNGPSNQPASESRPAQVARALSWLKAEQNAADAPAYTSMLLHESAVILESSGEDPEAVRNYRAALSFDPDFREPLERLIALAERHRNLDEVGTLYQQLAAAADSADERARACLEQAFFLLERKDDAASAMQLLRDVVADSPSNVTAWLLLDLVADRLGDMDTREQAIQARLGLTDNPDYRALLYLDWSALREQAGEVDRALDLLDIVVSEASKVTYLALLRRESVALRFHRTSEYLRTIQQRIRLVTRAMEDPEAGDALGVLHTHRNATALGCLHVTESLIHRQAGALEQAEQCLKSAEECLSSDLVLKYLAWLQAEHSEDWDRYSEIGQELAQSATGTSAAWIWLRLAIARHRLDDAHGAREFVNQGLHCDGGSLALRAFDVHLAIAKSDGLYLASSIEACTECFATESDKSAWLLAAAGIWAVLVRDASGAKAAIAQAGLHGLNSDLAHRLSRLLALWVGDPWFYDDSTRIAQKHAATPLERIDLLLELLRARLFRRDYAKSMDAATQLSASDDCKILGALVDATLGNFLRRQLGKGSEPPRPPTGTGLDWEALSAQAPTREMQRALHLGAVVQLLLADRVEDAQRTLDQLAVEDPSDVLVTAARVALELGADRPQRATTILRRTAECTPDANLRAALALEGALLAVKCNQLDDLPQLLDLVKLTHPEAALAFSRWILRRVCDQDRQLAQRVCESSDSIGSPARRALERLGLSLKSGNWDAPFDEPTNDAKAPLDVAVVIAKLLGGELPPELQTGSPPVLVAAHAALRYLEAIGTAEAAAETTVDVAERLSAARQWANSEPSLVAQLQWLLASRAAAEVLEEADARDRVADLLPSKDADAVRVSAQLMRFLTLSPTLVLLPSTSAASRLANLEIALPGCDPRRRAAAIDEVGELLGSSSTPVLRVCSALNQIAAGALDVARVSLSELVDTHPRFIPAWLGLRLIGEQLDDRGLLAQACAALGDLFADPAEAAAEWERAATLLLDDLADTARGQMALERAVALDITRDAAFNRLFRIVRDSQNTDQLLSLIAARLPHASTQSERLMLHWERARALRNRGDREGALVELEAVSAIDPNHVGALALAGEINIASGRFDDAARYLSQLAQQAEAPVKQRLMGGLAAADLFDKKLNRPAFAKDILLALHREGHSTEALRERLSALAVRVNDYKLALELLQVLMAERKTSASRADAARLALVVCRDHLQQPALAASAVERLLLELPADAEALDLVLTGSFAPADTERWLGDADQLIRQRLVEQPLEPESLERLANIANWFGDVRSRQTCLGALFCLGAGTPEYDAELTLLDGRIAQTPAMAISEETLIAIGDPEDSGPIAALFQDFATVFAEALGPTLQVLGVGKKQRVDPRAGLPLRNEIVAWAGAFGIVDFDLYVAERVAGDAIAIPTERPSLVVAAGLSAPLDARGRQAVARELYALRRGTSLLRHRSPTELSALVVACCQVGGHPLAAPSYAMLEEFVRAFSSSLPRRLRKTLTERAELIRTHCGSDADIRAYLRAANTSQDRAAAIAAGDISHVLAHLTGQRGQRPSTNELRDRVARLLSFALSHQYLQLKDQLGLSVR